MYVQHLVRWYINTLNFNAIYVYDTLNTLMLLRRHIDMMIVIRSCTSMRWILIKSTQSRSLEVISSYIYLFPTKQSLTLPTNHCRRNMWLHVCILGNFQVFIAPNSETYPYYMSYMYHLLSSSNISTIFFIPAIYVPSSLFHVSFPLGKCCCFFQQQITLTLSSNVFLC